MGSLTDDTVAKLAGQKKEPGETIEGVEKEAKNMSVVDGAMNTARKLAGTDALQEQVQEANRRAEKATDAAKKAEEDKHRAEIEKVEATLGAKIDGLAKSYAGGADKDSIATQIAEIKKAANELGMGGSRVSELREMMNLISTLNTQKSLSDQIKDAKELITAITPAPDKTGGLTVGGMPATIALELKKMETDLQLRLEEMKDERQRRDQEFKLTMRQYDETRQDRIAEANARIQVEQERNKMISGGLETIGRAIGRGAAEAARQGPRPSGPIAGAAAEAPKSYHVELPQGEVADFDCPNCSAKIAVGPDSTQAKCAGCNAVFPVVRTPGVMAGPEPPEEE